MKTVEAAVSQAWNETPAAQQAPFLPANGHATVPGMEREERCSQVILAKKGSVLQRWELGLLN